MNMYEEQLRQVEEQLARVRAELGNRLTNDSNHLGMDEMDRYQREIIDLERRRRELSETINRSASTMTPEEQLRQVEEELAKVRAELQNRLTNDSNHLGMDEMDRYQREIIDLERRRRELSEAIDRNPTQPTVNYLEEAKKIADRIKELEEELRKYYSGELTDSFGVRSSEINRELAELRNKLEDLKSKLTPEELAELERYINGKDSTKITPISRDDGGKIKNNDGYKDPIPPTPPVPPHNPELPQEQQQKPKKVTSVKKWIKDHKKVLIALGIAALATVAVINAVPVIMAGNAALWHASGPAMQAFLHSMNMGLGGGIQGIFGAHSFAGATGIHTFAGTELAKVAAASAVKLAASATGIGLGIKALKSGSPAYKEFKKELNRMKRNQKRANELDYDKEMNHISGMEMYINDARDNGYLTQNEFNDLMNRIDKLRYYLEDAEKVYVEPEIEDVVEEVESPLHKISEELEKKEDRDRSAEIEKLKKEKEALKALKNEEKIEHPEFDWNRYNDYGLEYGPEEAQGRGR